MVTCDGCLATAKVHNQNELPVGWIKVYVRGWIGAFHACSGSCEERIRIVREIKSVPRTPIIIIS